MVRYNTEIIVTGILEVHDSSDLGETLESVRNDIKNIDGLVYPHVSVTVLLPVKETLKN